MGDDVKEKLRELINTQGQQILHDPNKFTSLMLDLCLGTNEREINILATALTKRIPQHLQSSGSNSLTEELRSNLSHRLENETGLRTDVANWAVNTWAAALGIAIGRGPDVQGADGSSQLSSYATDLKSGQGPIESTILGKDTKSVTHPWWFWAAITLLSIALLIQGALTGNVDTVKVSFSTNMLVITVCTMPFTILGIIFLRKGMHQPPSGSLMEERVSKWWWLPPILWGFLGGIGTWFQLKDINHHKAINMLSLGILTTIIWSIPILVLRSA